jgi:hypothetical protein
MSFDTAIFLTHRFFNLYDFEQLKLAEKLRFVAIVAKSAEPSISAEVKAHFDKIVYIDQEVHWPHPLSYSQANVVVRVEMSSKSVVIICNDDVNMLNAGKLREAYRLSGMYEKQSLLFSNKIDMKEALKKSHILTPKFQLIDVRRYKGKDEKYYASLVHQLGSPFVLKPFNAASSLGLKIVKNSSDFFSITDPNMIDSFEVENFIDGELYHCDTLMQDGEILFQGVAKYSRPMGEFLQGRPIATEILIDETLLTKEMKKFTETVLKSFKMTDGVSHTEIFRTKSNKLYFLETAARAPGGLTVPAYEKAYGLNLLTLDFHTRIFKKLPPISITPKEKLYVGCSFFPLFDGLITVKKYPYIKSEFEMTWTVETGTRVQRSDSLSDTSAVLLLWSRDKGMFMSDLTTLYDFECITVTR